MELRTQLLDLAFNSSGRVRRDAFHNTQSALDTAEPSPQILIFGAERRDLPTDAPRALLFLKGVTVTRSYPIVYDSGDGRDCDRDQHECPETHGLPFPFPLHG
jgi:hypothetical protein